MTKPEFQTQVLRLEKQFGPYGMERAMILWSKVQSFSERWFKAVMDNKIASCRFIPLPSDFDEDVSQEHENIWQREKGQNKEDAKKFLRDGWGTWPGDDKRTTCERIRDRLQGKMTDAEWASFYSSLKNAANQSPPDGSSATNANGGAE